MPRIARSHAPGSLVHLVSSFAAGAFMMDLPGARAEYLSRVPAALRGTDWIPLAYALMSTHVHWALVAGQQAPRSFYHPLHTGFAGWVNQQRRDRLARPARRLVGPVFADRPKTFVVAPEALPRLLSCLHNNPVRAGLASHAGGSDWTSHRQYLDPGGRLPWLAVGDALAWAGFGDTPEGRRSFHEATAVLATCDGGWFPGHDRVCAVRTLARARANAPVELQTPRMVSRDGVGETTWSWGLVRAVDQPLDLRWEGAVEHFLSVVSGVAGIDEALLVSRDRRRDLAQARRLAVLAWTRNLGRRLTEVSAALAISVPAAIALVRRRPDTVAGLATAATEVAERCWASSGPRDRGAEVQCREVGPEAPTGFRAPAGRSTPRPLRPLGGES